MKYLFVIFCSVFVLAGCANQDKRSVELSSHDGVTYERFNGKEVLAEYERNEKPIYFSQDKLARCTIQSLKNDATTLSDSSNSFVGSYTGNYYNVTKTDSIAGGGVIKYMMKDSVGLIAEAKTMYSTTFIARAVKYNLLIEKLENSVDFKITNIMQAQLDTGAISNTGFYKVGSWSSAEPVLVINSINSDIDKVYKCLSQ